MPQYKIINHMLFEEQIPIKTSFGDIFCLLRVSCMRYDEDGLLFFPVFAYADDDNIYISITYRLYPDGRIIQVQKSGDVDDAIDQQVVENIAEKRIPEQTMNFVCQTRYDEIIPAQSC